MLPPFVGHGSTVPQMIDENTPTVTIATDINMMNSLIVSSLTSSPRRPALMPSESSQIRSFLSWRSW